MTKISFPGLGIAPFALQSTAFTVFGLEIKWYGIIITLGMVLAFLLVLGRCRYEKVNPEHIYDLAIFIIIFGVIGARLYYVLFNLKEFHGFFDIINIRGGGLAIYGAIIAGALTAFIFAKIKKIDFRTLFDMLAPAVMLGQIVGRWGNFMNAEAYGGETDLPWRMTIDRGYESISVHPTFLYESLWNLLGFILISVFYRKKRYQGQVTLWYFTWYGIGRFFIEGLRSDSLYLGSTSIRVSQLLAGLTAVFGAVCLIVFGILTRNGRKIACAETKPEQKNEGKTESVIQDSEDNTESAIQANVGENQETESTCAAENPVGTSTAFTTESDGKTTENTHE